MCDGSVGEGYLILTEGEDEFDWRRLWIFEEGENMFSVECRNG